MASVSQTSISNAVPELQVPSPRSVSPASPIPTNVAADGYNRPLPTNVAADGYNRPQGNPQMWTPAKLVGAAVFAAVLGAFPQKSIMAESEEADLLKKALEPQKDNEGSSVVLSPRGMVGTQPSADPDISTAEQLKRGLGVGAGVDRPTAEEELRNYLQQFPGVPETKEFQVNHLAVRATNSDEREVHLRPRRKLSRDICLNWRGYCEGLECGGSLLATA